MAENREDVAERKRTDQGLHECEVFKVGSDAMEGNLSWTSCEKNPGHPSFIPYPDFRMEHLPEELRSEDVFSKVVELAERTVKLRVGYTSMARPERFPFYNVRGTSVVHTGSGWIEQVVLQSDTPCPCSDCARNDSPHQGDWLEVNVLTARHVVFDAEEARSTLVDVHYNTKDSRLNGTMKTIRVYDVLSSDSAVDACLLVCASHSLAAQLSIPFKVSYKLKPSIKPRVCGPCVVISHPHGNPKQVTVGEVKDADPRTPTAFITYNSSTCRGSSGAPVLAFNTEASEGSGIFIHSMGGLHGGLNEGSCVYITFE
ncbi:hypothetical protein RRG08_015359 [Elysia crispata]|uniref:Uncharacterized protein n=1 Tax=Elysia crispata TaxID=231223 RepID=A0AAE1A811_9GAST|nr:hypothetical protein RRG08_015359 [Elysia crispata]